MMTEISFLIIVEQKNYNKINRYEFYKKNLNKELQESRRCRNRSKAVDVFIWSERLGKKQLHKSYDVSFEEFN